MISKVVHNLFNIGTPSRSEHFAEENSRGYKLGIFLASLLTFLVIILVLGLIGQWLWNFTLAGDNGKGLITVVKKADSVWQIIALYLLLGLLFGH